jgi:hypothetical protein
MDACFIVKDHTGHSVYFEGGPAGERRRSWSLVTRRGGLPPTSLAAGTFAAITLIGAWFGASRLAVCTSEPAYWIAGEDLT